MALAVWWCWDLHWSVDLGAKSYTDDGEGSDSYYTIQVRQSQEQVGIIVLLQWFFTASSLSWLAYPALWRC